MSLKNWGCFKAFLDPKALGSFVSHLSVPGPFLTLSFKRRIGVKRLILVSNGHVSPLKDKSSIGRMLDSRLEVLALM